MYGIVIGFAAPVVTTGKEGDKLARNNTEHAYGTPFVRAVMPHHLPQTTGKISKTGKA